MGTTVRKPPLDMNLEVILSHTMSYPISRCVSVCMRPHMNRKLSTSSGKRSEQHEASHSVVKSHVFYIVFPTIPNPPISTFLNDRQKNWANESVNIRWNLAAGSNSWFHSVPLSSLYISISLRFCSMQLLRLTPPEGFTRSKCVTAACDSASPKDSPLCRFAVRCRGEVSPKMCDQGREPAVCGDHHWNESILNTSKTYIL